LASGLFEEVHDVEFDETNGSQDEEDNLDDVRGTQLTNAMKEMDIGDIRPKQVIDVDDNKDQVLQSPITQASGSLMQNQASTSSQVQQDQQVASSSSPTHDQHQHPSNQAQVLQPTNIARDHPLDSIIGDIQRGVQTRSRLTSFCAHSSFVSIEEPKDIDRALRDPDWVNAMHEELNNFKRNEVWELVERPKDHNVVGIRWVFRNKQDQDGIVVRNKARLVAQGACAHNIKLYQIDVKSAFLNGYIQEEVYVEQPPGFEDDKKPNHVYKLRKTLYGLKQVPRVWYERLRDFLLSKGFVMGKVDITLLPRRLGKTCLCCKYMLMISYSVQPIKIIVMSLGK
jgi:hypothetical protein